MAESYQPAAESGPKLPVPIIELVDGISDADAALLTRIAQFDLRLTAIADNLQPTLPTAMDRAFMYPHSTAKVLREDNVHGVYSIQALELAQEAERSGIAYRISANQKLVWMARITDRARFGLREDSVFTDRKDAYQNEPNAPWLYRKMQSRLLVCLAWMAEGREMERRVLSRNLRERIARELMMHVLTDTTTDGI